jgi:hypothetical protein
MPDSTTARRLAPPPPRRAPATTVSSPLCANPPRHKSGCKWKRHTACPYTPPANFSPYGISGLPRNLCGVCGQKHKVHDSQRLTTKIPATTIRPTLLPPRVAASSAPPPRRSPPCCHALSLPPPRPHAPEDRILCSTTRRRTRSCASSPSLREPPPFGSSTLTWGRG